jgi:small subunit ribosomal protein S1
MNQEEKKVGLSIRAVGEEASRAEVELYKEASSAREHHGSGSSGGGKGKGSKGNPAQSSTSSSSSTTLGDLLNWKRSERED